MKAIICSDLYMQPSLLSSCLLTLWPFLLLLATVAPNQLFCHLLKTQLPVIYYYKK